MPSFVGVDLGGTTVAAAVVDITTGQIAGRATLPTRAHEGAPAVLARMAGLVIDVIEAADLSRTDVGGIGVGVPGLYDLTTGHTRFLPNLPGAWRGVPAGPTLREKTGLPTWLINDARAFILAEFTFGAGRGTHTVVGMTLGTGIGGGAVVNGQLHLGLDGTAGEVGHQIIDFNGPPCGCGSRGCLETFASGPAIVAMGLKAVKQGLTTRIGALVDYDLNKITPETIVQAAEQGDAIAADILERAGIYIGIGVANLITLFSPDRVIIGGGVAQAGEWLFRPIRETARQRCHVTPIERVDIVPAALGTDAGTVGAAVWAGQRARADAEGGR